MEQITIGAKGRRPLGKRDFNSVFESILKKIGEGPYAGGSPSKCKLDALVKNGLERFTDQSLKVALVSAYKNKDVAEAHRIWNIADRENGVFLELPTFTDGESKNYPPTSPQSKREFNRAVRIEYAYYKLDHQE